MLERNKRSKPSFRPNIKMFISGPYSGKLRVWWCHEEIESNTSFWPTLKRILPWIWMGSCSWFIYNNLLNCSEKQWWSWVMGQQKRRGLQQPSLVLAYQKMNKISMVSYCNLRKLKFQLAIFDWGLTSILLSTVAWELPCWPLVARVVGKNVAVNCVFWIEVVNYFKILVHVGVWPWFYSLTHYYCDQGITSTTTVCLHFLFLSFSWSLGLATETLFNRHIDHTTRKRKLHRTSRKCVEIATMFIRGAHESKRRWFRWFLSFFFVLTSILKRVERKYIRISKLHYTCLYADYTKNHEEANILLIIILI